MRAPLLILVSLFAGCASAPAADQMAKGDYGPAPEDYQAQVKDYMNARLRDPSGAVYEFYRPLAKSWYGFGGTGQYGWATCATINAKNGYGGMTGAKPSYFLFKDGLIIQAIHSEDQGNRVTELCSTL